ncbi:MAG: hypothetical protein PHQ72_07120 [Hespellia sp.]|nr:hypothetical protein [Hespellia sp.]
MNENRIDHELEELMNQEVEIPEAITKRIEETCRQCKREEEKTGGNVIPMKKRSVWKTVAAVAAVCVIGSTGVMAATGVFSTNKQEDGNQTKYNIEVDKEAIAHDVTVTPQYTVPGYVDELQNEDDSSDNDQQADEAHIKALLESNPDADEQELRENYQGYLEMQTPTSQWFSYATRDSDGNFQGGYSVSVYNAQKLDNIMDNWEGSVFEYQKVAGEEKTSIQNLDTRIFTYKTESGCPMEEILMFNSTEGFVIQISWGLDDKTVVSEDEMKKVAEGLRIDVSDKEISYMTDEKREIYKRIEDLENNMTKLSDDSSDRYAAGISADEVVGIGDTFTGDTLWADAGAGDASYTITDVSVKDAISNEEYGKEHYFDYDGSVAQWVNEDGTLKAHDRLCTPFGSEDSTEENGIHSKYVVVKVKEKNLGKETADMAIPYLMSLVKAEDGHYAYPDKNYSPYGDYRLQGGIADVTTANDAIYFSEADNYKEVKGETVWGEHSLAAGEEKEYTVIYVVDDDQLSNMMLTFDSLKLKREFVDIRQ